MTFEYAYAGIDPGKNGGLAMIYKEEFASESVLLFPFAYCCKWDIFSSVPDQCQIILEQVVAMPGQGVTSMFSFGFQAGLIEGWLAARELEYELWRPAEWQEWLNLKLSAGKGLAAQRKRELIWEHDAVPAISCHNVQCHPIPFLAASDTDISGLEV